MCKQLTILELSVHCMWLNGTHQLNFPNMITVSICIAGIYHHQGSQSQIKLLMPNLVSTQFFVVNTHFISFTESTFSATLKRLEIFTPSLKGSPLVHPALSGSATFQPGADSLRIHADCLVYHPELKEAVIAAHDT
jgi:hypothetical protein